MVPRGSFVMGSPPGEEERERVPSDRAGWSSPQVRVTFKDDFAVGKYPVTRAEFARTLSVFLPTAALAAGMLVLGCYVPSAVYLAWMMRRHGGRRWPLSAAFGAAVMVAFFLVFDVWFRVPLAKGPVEAAFGVY